MRARVAQDRFGDATPLGLLPVNPGSQGSPFLATLG